MKRLSAMSSTESADSLSQSKIDDCAGWERQSRNRTRGDLACGTLTLVEMNYSGGRGFSFSPKASSRGKLIMSGQ